MSLSEKRKFTFTWQIRNFSMCPQKHGAHILSPVFVVDKLKNSEWYLEFYPRGKEKEDTMECFVIPKDAGCYSNDLEIGFSFTVFSVDIEKKITRGPSDIKPFELHEGWGYDDLVTRDVILDDKDSYLPNDTFTLKCSLWKMDEDSCSEQDPFADALRKEIFVTAFREDQLEPGKYEINSCSVLTHINVQKKTVSWPIKRFSSLGPNQRLTIPVQSALKDTPTYFLTLYKAIADQCVHIEIRREKTNSSKQVLVKCKVSVLHTPKSVRYFDEDEHIFESDVDNDVWKFPTFIKLDKLQEDKYLDGTYDVLHLRFEFAFSSLDGMHHVERDIPTQPEVLSNVPPTIQEFERLCVDGELSDFSLRVGDRDFKVHKVILMARSHVFGAMFDNDMKENKTAVANITDMDSETLARMLKFMYTNAVEVAEVADAVKLYLAADKFQILPLKMRCCCILISSLSVSNACEILNLTYLHEEEYLHECAENFIHANFVEIFDSKEWKDLIKCNKSLAARVMHKILTN